MEQWLYTDKCHINIYDIVISIQKEFKKHNIEYTFDGDVRKILLKWLDYKDKIQKELNAQKNIEYIALSIKKNMICYSDFITGKCYCKRNKHSILNQIKTLNKKINLTEREIDIRKKLMKEYEADVLYHYTDYNFIPYLQAGNNSF